VREDDRVDLIDGEGQFLILLARFLAAPLEHPAVEQHRLAADAEDVAGTRDLARGAGEFDLHAALSLAVAWPLEHQRETVLVLGHHRGLPSPSAPLVQEIGQCVFVVACMS
jgi:hypothetical protein